MASGVSTAAGNVDSAQYLATSTAAGARFLTGTLPRPSP